MRPCLPILATLLLGSVVAGCKSSDAALHNLRELHLPDGNVDRRAAPMGHFEYGLRRAFSAAPIRALGLSDEQPGGFVDAKPERDVRRPQERIRRELATLDRLSGKSRRSSGLAVEAATWLAVDDPSEVVREMATGMLASAADRMGVRESPSPGGVAVEDAVTPEALRLVLLRLFEEFEERDLRGLERTFGELGVLRYTRDGALRALRAQNALLADADRLEPVRRPFDELHDSLQRECVRLGLADTLLDPAPRVRARAVEGLAVTAPDALLAELERAYRAGDAEVLASGLRAASQRSLVGDAELERWCDLAVRTADLPNGPAAVAASRLLGDLAPRLTGEELPLTLRSERWILWWHEARTHAGPDVEASDGQQGGA